MNEPEFLKVKAGDTVLVGEDEIARFSNFFDEKETHMLPHFLNRKR